MSKKLPKRYVNEKAVKRALGIDSFRNVSKDKIMEFASLIPYMDKDVAIAIINQFPVYADFGKANISEIERKSITEDMIAVADKIAEADLQNKNFLERMGTKLLWAVGIGFAAIGAGIGIHSAFGGGDSLPQVSGDEEDR